MDATVYKHKQKRNGTTLKELAGIIPAAGYANRISPLPCSKEIYPVGFLKNEVDGSLRPRVVSSYLLESMKYAGAGTAYIIIRNGKWDIAEYYKDGQGVDLNIAYLVTPPTDATPFTIDKAYPFIRNKTVLFGFPDIVFEPKTMFSALLSKQKTTGADIVLSLFEADNPQKMDMVKLNDEGMVTGIDIKPRKTDLTYTWISAVWSDTFTQYMHSFLLKEQQNPDSTKKGRELYVGDIVRDAIHAGLTVESVIFSEGYYRDIGTADDLKKSIQES